MPKINWGERERERETNKKIGLGYNIPQKREIQGPKTLK